MKNPNILVKTNQNERVEDIFKPIISNTWTAQLSDNVYYYVGDQDIYQLNTYFVKNGKIKQGKRHNPLFRFSAIIRNIYPEVSMEVVLANGLDYLHCPVKVMVEVQRIKSNG